MSIEHTDVLIAGAGLGGARVAEGLRAAGFDGRIVVAGAERHGRTNALPCRSGCCSASARSLPSGCGRTRTGGSTPSTCAQAKPLIRSTSAPAGLPQAAVSCAGGVSCWRRASAPAASPTSRDSRTSITCVRRRCRELRDSLLGGGRLAVIGAGFVGLEAASAASGWESTDGGRPGAGALPDDPRPGGRKADGTESEIVGVDLRLADIDRARTECERPRGCAGATGRLAYECDECRLASDRCPTARSPAARCAHGRPGDHHR